MESNKQVTAVEWLVEQFSDILGKIKTEPIQDLLLIDAFNKAKEMDKEQRRYSKEDMQSAWDASRRFERLISKGNEPNFNEFIDQFNKKES
jgi:hypothetical protein